MTDKQEIIIDGVDVSGCEFAEASATTPKCQINGYIHCDGYNCRYKQLQRKTAEYERLTNKNNRLTEELNQIKLLLEGKNNQYSAKQQECEELKKQVVCYGCGTCNGKEDYKNMQRHLNNAIESIHKKHKEIDRYKQALDEIEKYTIKEFCENCEADDYPASCPTCEYKEYLDIISKAKGEENAG